MRPAPPRSVYRSTNKYFVRDALSRFANNRKLVCEQFLAMASRISTSLPFDAENTGYDEKSVSTAPRSYQNLTCDDAGDSFFCM